MLKVRLESEVITDGAEVDFAGMAREWECLMA